MIYTLRKQGLKGNLYEKKWKEGIGVILDDRDNVNIGAKIKDCKVLGTPNLIVIGERTKGENKTWNCYKDGKYHVRLLTSKPAVIWLLSATAGCWCYK